jgi:hypothetical protein
MAMTATKSKKIKAKYGTVIATPYEPPKPKAKPKKPLDPEIASRKIRALKQFLDDGDIDMKQFWQMKQRVLDQMLGDK